MRNWLLTLPLALCLSCNLDDPNAQNGGLGAGEGERPPGPGPRDPMVFGKMNVGGSRLKAKVIVGADGSKNYPGMYDTMLKTDCAYDLTADGKVRCLPTNQIVELRSGGNVYADASCKGGLVAYSFKAQPPMSYLVSPWNTPGQGPVSARSSRSFFRLTELSPAPTVLYLGNGSCDRIPLTVDEYNSYRYYTADKVAAAQSDFAEAADVKLE